MLARCVPCAQHVGAAMPWGVCDILGKSPGKQVVFINPCWVLKICLLYSFQKINQKFITNKEEFDTLQKIVLHEVNEGVAQVRNSATEALLWLKR